MEATFPFGDHQFSTDSSPTPTDLMTYFQHTIPAEVTMDDLPWEDDSGAGDIPPDAHSGDTSNRSTAADAMEVNAAAGQGQSVPQLVGLAGPTEILDGHTDWDWRDFINRDLSQIQAVEVPTGSFTGAGTEEMMQSGSLLPGTHTASAEDVQPVVKVNAALAHQQPYPYSTGDTRCCASTAAAGMGNRSPDLEVKAGVGLPESGGGALTEAAVRGSCKRKKLVCGSSMQSSTPQFNLVELYAGLVQSDPSSTDIKPRTGSTDIEIISFLKSMPRGKEVNLSLGEQDRMAPKAAGSYVTTVTMMPDKKTHLGYWKEKQVEALCPIDGPKKNWFMELCQSLCPGPRFAGLKRTFQFHGDDGTKTNWFMDEYTPTGHWGIDLYMEPLRFRKVYQGAEVPGEPTSPDVKIKNKSAAAKKHRMRGPENLVIKGESPAWQHLIKIYDRHPELEGSKVVYAVCCHCEGVLKAGTENGTKSLLTHCNSTCPILNKKQQQATSSR